MLTSPSHFPRAVVHCSLRALKLLPNCVFNVVPNLHYQDQVLLKRVALPLSTLEFHFYSGSVTPAIRSKCTDVIPNLKADVVRGTNIPVVS